MEFFTCPLTPCTPSYKPLCFPKDSEPLAVPVCLLSSNGRACIPLIRPGVILETGKEEGWSSLSTLPDISAAVTAQLRQTTGVKHHTGFGFPLPRQRQVHQCLTRCWETDVSSAQRPASQPARFSVVLYSLSSVLKKGCAIARGRVCTRRAQPFLWLCGLG